MDAPDSTPPRTPLAERLFAALVAVAALDLGTSAFPSVIDVFGPVTRVPMPVRVLESLVVLAGVVVVYRRRRAWRARLAGLPIPRPARYVLSAYLLVFFGHVLFRAETFPFSNVGMFSAVPATVDFTTPRTERGVVLIRGRGVTGFSPLLEAVSAVSRFDEGWDYKLGWTMWMFGTSHSEALGEIDRLARAHGFDGAARAEISFDPRTGRLLGVRPIAGRRRSP